jgi:hypothetical protein
LWPKVKSSKSSKTNSGKDWLQRNQPRIGG